MAENTNENTNAEATEVKPTEAELKAVFESLPSEIQGGIKGLNEAIDVHNSNVDKVKASEAKDPKLIRAEIFEQNPGNNEKLARLLKEEEKHREAIERIRKQAYEIIDRDGLMPKELSEEEVTRLKAEITTKTKSLREQVAAFEMMEGMMPMFKGKLLMHLHEIKTRRGAAKTGVQSSAQSGVKRPRFKKILVNGSDQDTINGKTVTVWQEVSGEPKYTMTFLSQFLRKKSAVINWTAKDLQDAYFGDKSDQSEIPDSHTFVMTHHFKDENGHEKSVDFEITAIK